MSKKEMEVPIGNLYDLNKGLIKKDGKLNKQGKKKIEQAKELVCKYIKKTDNCYYALLNYENKDFTICDVQSGISLKTAAQVEDLFSIVENRGSIYSVDISENNQAIQFWIEIKGQMYCYLFFAYDNGVVILNE